MNGSRNGSTPEPSVDTLTLTSVTGVFFMIFYVTVVLLSLVGNSLVLVVCYRSLRGRRGYESAKGPFFNHYIANLAISDLLFTLLTFFDALYAIHGEWQTGNATCKIQGFSVETCYTASILTLIAISKERMQTITRNNLASRLQKGRERKITITLIWIVAIVICSPLLYAYSTHNAQGVILCTNLSWGHVGRKVYYSLTAVLLFFAPLVLMIWCDIKINKVLKSQVAPNEHMLKAIRTRQKKASRILAMVILMFFLFWSPFILMRTLRYFDWYSAVAPWKLAQLIVIASSASNPFVYCFYSMQFRRYFKIIITCRCRYISPNDGTTETSCNNGTI